MSVKQHQQDTSGHDGRQQGSQKASRRHGGQYDGQRSSQPHGGPQQAEAPAGRPIPDPVQIRTFLGGLDYPLRRADLIARARAEGADENMLGALLRIPDRAYDSPVSVSKEVGDRD